VRITRRARYGVLASALSLLGFGSGAWADPPTDTAAAQPANSSADDAPKTLPQDGFFSSLKQAAKQGYDHEVVRGHFDLGTPPNVHRYYCLVDVKTHAKEPNGVLGDPVPAPGGMTAIKNSSVSMYTCANAEKQGMLVTAGYGVGVAAAAPRMGPIMASRMAATAQTFAAFISPHPRALRNSVFLALSLRCHRGA